MTDTERATIASIGQALAAHSLDRAIPSATYSVLQKQAARLMEIAAAPTLKTFVVNLRAIQHLTHELEVQAADEAGARAIADEIINTGSVKWAVSDPEDEQIEVVEELP